MRRDGAPMRSPIDSLRRFSAPDLAHRVPIMADEVLERFSSLNVWSRAGIRAPHKPLLILLALGRLSRGQTHIPYAECESELTELLREFGPSTSSLHPEYPFWRLQNDGLWVVDSDRTMRTRASNTDPPRTELRSANARGHFPPSIQHHLHTNPQLIRQLVQRILNAHFPESLHDDILSLQDHLQSDVMRARALLAELLGRVTLEQRGEQVWAEAAIDAAQLLGAAGGSGSLLFMVAGEGFEPSTFGL